MTRRGNFGLAIGCGLLVLTAGTAPAGGAKARKGRSGLDAARRQDPSPSGKVAVRVAAQGGREVLVVNARRLAPRTVYRLFLDDPFTADPSPVEVSSGETNRRGRLVFRFGSRSRPLPFDASADALAGGRVELRGETGSVVLGAVVPVAGKGPLALAAGEDGGESAAEGDEPVCVDRDGVTDCAPTADAGTAQAVECQGGRTHVTLDGSASSDPEGAELLYGWTGAFVEGTARGVAPTVTFDGPGVYRVTLVVSDGFFRSAPASVPIEIADTAPPRIVAPDDLTVECDGHRGTAVRLGQPQVHDACDPSPRVGNDAPALFPLGTTTVTWTAVDASGNAATDTQQVTVEDTTPPELEIGGLPLELWPPNHQMVRIEPRIVLADACDPHPELTVRVASSESDNATGDGNTTGDIVIHSARDIELRAERSGSGSGRTYTLVWTARDESGNETHVRHTIDVPHSQGNGNGNSGDHGNSHSNGNGRGR